MGRMTITRFLREQWTNISLPTVTTFIHSKSVVIIGANTGLGFEAAKHVIRLSPRRLVLACRDLQKGEEARTLIERDCPTAAAQHMQVQHLDLASFASVRAFADNLAKENEGLNCLLANAAVATGSFVRSEDGWETTLQVNYLSHALLIILLLPELIKASTPNSLSRVVLVSSDGHYFTNNLHSIPGPSILATLNDLQYCTPSVMKQRYNLSKLLIIAFVRGLSARLPQETPVIVCAANPGFCHSSLTRESESRIFGKWLVYLLKASFARSADMGGRVLAHALTDPEAIKLHGHYVSNCEVSEESDILLGPEGDEVCNNIWNDTVRILESVDNRVEEIISRYLTTARA